MLRFRPTRFIFDLECFVFEFLGASCFGLRFRYHHYNNKHYLKGVTERDFKSQSRVVEKYNDSSADVLSVSPSPERIKKRVINCGFWGK